MKELLKTVIADQLEFGWKDEYVKRVFPQHLLDSEDIVVISGVRRCGKSTLLQQIRAKQDERDYYLNFDDDRLVLFKLEHFQLLFSIFIELFGEQNTFYFDEIQNVKGWERFIRRLHDHGKKVFLTGSNAKMLSKELGTHLTGRVIPFELYPFSFVEYLTFNRVQIESIELLSTSGQAEIAKLFDQYLSVGGFPVFIKTQSTDYLKSLYQGIIYRDVLVRNNITNDAEMLELVYYLTSNISKRTSNNSLKDVIGVKNATTVKNYIQFLQDSYLFFQISRFDYSLKKQIYNPKKTYIIDNAMANILGFSFSKNQGRMLENLVFIELQRRAKDVYYHDKKYECDFVIRKNRSISEAIQVCYFIDDKRIKQREIRGLKDALDSYNLDSGLILTAYQEEEINLDNKKIFIYPTWKWLLLPS